MDLIHSMRRCEIESLEKVCRTSNQNTAKDRQAHVQARDELADRVNRLFVDEIARVFLNAARIKYI